MKYSPSQRLVLATRNRDKLREIQAVLTDMSLSILSMNDFPDFPVVEETGETLAENAIKKAREVHLATGLPALADDTGLEVDALGGCPGVCSSRFAGETATYQENVLKLLRELSDFAEPQRTARFHCVMALAYADKKVLTAEGICEGAILLEPRGANGFGYDPVFYIPEYRQTFAEMPAEIKNRISHRGLALTAMKQQLRRHFKEVFYEK